ncbi:hypothetical protein TNCV_541401 [Trichonephila clavipes]|nr:hypothetical protein TNCV_541401 [Trichonephila clavipes]
MSVLSQPAYFAHANVFHHDGKPLPIKLSIATIPRDGSEPEIMCITVNHAGQTSKPKDFRSDNCQENARLRLVHHPLPKSVPVEYLPFCVRGKFSQLARGNRGLVVVKGVEQQKNFKSSDCMPWPWRICRNSKTFAMEPFPTPCMRVCTRVCTRKRTFRTAPC